MRRSAAELVAYLQRLEMGFALHCGVKVRVIRSEDSQLPEGTIYNGIRIYSGPEGEYWWLAERESGDTLFCWVSGPEKVTVSKPTVLSRLRSLLFGEACFAVFNLESPVVVAPDDLRNTDLSAEEVHSQTDFWLCVHASDVMLALWFLIKMQGFIRFGDLDDPAFRGRVAKWLERSQQEEVTIDLFLDLEEKDCLEEKDYNEALLFVAGWALTNLDSCPQDLQQRVLIQVKSVVWAHLEKIQDEESGL